MVWPGYAKMGTVPIPMEPICQALWVYPYLWATLHVELLLNVYIEEGALTSIEWMCQL